MSATIIARNVRLSFDKNLIDPSEPKGKRKGGKRSVNLIASADSAFFRLDGKNRIPVKAEGLTAVLEEVLKAKFNGKVPAKYENWAIRKNVDSVSSTTGDRFMGYEDDDGFYFAPSRFEEDGFPAFLRQDNTLINPLTEEGLAECRRMFYAGCYVTAKINIGAYETKEDTVTKRGVTTFLEGLQFLKQGERFGRSEASAEGFEDESSESDGFDEDDV